MRLAFWKRRRTADRAVDALWAPQPVFYPGDVAARPAEPAVSIGFRDGSTVDVEPDSPQGRALRAAADVLAARDS